jgi:acyl-coenzyme A synthetase/AMP-(fatty) acid ligase
MKSKTIAACILALGVATVGLAQTPSTTTYSADQIRQLVSQAHSPEQFKTLASYYDGQQQKYLAKAAEEKDEWVRRSQNVMVVAAKYPRPVDSARYLYEYYMTKASEAGALSAKFSRSADPGVMASAK